jgi:hypothetical protein
VGLSLLVLERVVPRLVVGPLVAIGALVLWFLHGNTGENSTVDALLPQLLHQYFKPQSLMSHAPLATALLAFTGLLAGIALVLWLITLGRGVREDWQVHLLAASVTLTQLAWIPLAISRMATPAALSGVNSRLAHQPLSLGPFFALIAVPAFLAGTLYIARRNPAVRLTLAAVLPPAGMALWLLLPHGLADPGVPQMGLSATAVWLEDLLRNFGALALVNPLALSFPQLLGIDPQAGQFYALFGQYRLLQLVTLQLVAIAVCAHAARLAVHDWRASED